MNLDKLHNLILIGESSTTEFKKSVTPDIANDICAFANSGGDGTILVGVSKDRKLTGILDHPNQKARILEMARSAKPAIQVNLHSIGSVLCVLVPKQHSKPYSIRGQFYARIGTETCKLTENEASALPVNEKFESFDAMPCLNFDLENDLSPELWQQFAQSANLSTTQTLPDTLGLLGLMTNGMIVHAGAWMLSDKISRWTPSAEVVCSLFMGRTNQQIIDRKFFNTPLQLVIDDCMKYIKSKLNSVVKPSEIQETEQLELPEDALREAVVNAIVHRDYRSTGCTEVKIYMDRLEIVSPKTSSTIQHNQDFQTTRSIPQNPLLFEMFRRMGLVNGTGKGLQKIYKCCRDYGTKSPDIQVSSDKFKIVFPRNNQHDSVKTLHVRSDFSPHVESHVGIEVSQKVQTVIGKMEQEHTRAEIVELLHLRDRIYVMKEYIHPAIEAGLIEMTKPDKPRSRMQKYRLTVAGKQFKRAKS